MNFYRIEYLAKYFSTASNITIFFSLYTFRVYKYIHEIYIRIIYIQIYIRRIVFLGMRVWMYDRVYKVWRAQLAWETK